MPDRDRITLKPLSPEQAEKWHGLWEQAQASGRCVVYRYAHQEAGVLRRPTDADVRAFKCSKPFPEGTLVLEVSDLGPVAAFIGEAGFGDYMERVRTGA